MRSFLSRNWKILAPIGVVGGIVVAYLAFAVFGIHTLFIDDKVNEEGPVFASGASAVVADDGAADDSAPDETTPAEATPPDDEVESAEPVADTDTPEIITLASGSFIAKDHPAEGTALVLTDGTE